MADLEARERSARRQLKQIYKLGQYTKIFYKINILFNIILYRKMPVLLRPSGN